MRRKGYDVRVVHHLTFRRGNPETDKDARGEAIHDGYVVPVRVKDCKPRPAADGRIYLDRDDLLAAPCLPDLIFTRSNMAYGPWRKQTRGKYAWRLLDDLDPALQAAYRENADKACIRHDHVWHYHEIYWSRPVYWVEDGRVFRGTVYRYNDPHAEAA